jgi:hypothetical protein
MKSAARTRNGLVGIREDGLPGPRLSLAFKGAFTAASGLNRRLRHILQIMIKFGARLKLLKRRPAPEKRNRLVASVAINIEYWRKPSIPAAL